MYSFPGTDHGFYGFSGIFSGTDERSKTCAEWRRTVSRRTFIPFQSKRESTLGFVAAAS
jgi:hypothetical protein